MGLLDPLNYRFIFYSYTILCTRTFFLELLSSNIKHIPISFAKVLTSPAIENRSSIPPKLTVGLLGPLYSDCLTNKDFE